MPGRLPTRWNYLASGALVIALIFLHYLGPLVPVEIFFRSIFATTAMKFREWRIQMANRYETSGQSKDGADLSKCQANPGRLDLLSARTQLLEEENKQLKMQLQFKARRSFRSVTADVIGNGIDNTGSVILISAGKNLGIEAGDPVINGDGIFVGIIERAEKDSSTARLINDNHAKVAATLLNRERSLGVVEGGYGISIRMNFIPRNEVVRIGDQVVTSGLEPRVPRGLIIGEVAASENEAYQPFQQAILTPAADLAKLTFVSVLLTH